MPTNYARPTIEILKRNGKVTTTYGDNLNPHQTVDSLNEDGTIKETQYVGTNGLPWFEPVASVDETPVEEAPVDVVETPVEEVAPSSPFTADNA